MTVCLLLTLNGCYQAQRQPPSPGGIDETGQQGQTVTGPFGEQIPDPARRSPFDQSGTMEPGSDSLESEVAGTMKPPALKAIDSRISEYNRKVAQLNELEGRSMTTAVDPEVTARIGGCLQETQRILGGYTTLRTAVVLGDSSNVAENSVYSARMQELQQADIRFLEGNCKELFGRVQAAPGPQSALPGAHPQET